MAAFDFQEIACPRCGSLNRRFKAGLLNDTQHAERCDHCGADLATGRMSFGARIEQLKVIALSFVACAFIGAFIVLAAGLFVMNILLPDPVYNLHRPAFVKILFGTGIAIGLVVGERNRRRLGLAPRRVARAPEGVAPPAQADEAVEVVDLSPEGKQSARNQRARNMLYLWAYAVAMFIGIVLAILSFDLESVLPVGVVLGLVAAFAYGRWSLPVRKRRA
jgi:hypothetical protein